MQTAKVGEGAMEMAIVVCASKSCRVVRFESFQPEDRPWAQLDRCHDDHYRGASNVAAATDKVDC